MQDEEDKVGEYYQRPKDKITQTPQQPSLDEEKDLLHKLSMSVGGMHYTPKMDGVGGERYEIEIATERGIRIIDWWTSNNTWQVRRGKGSGTGIYKLARYFQLMPRGGWEKLNE